MFNMDYGSYTSFGDIMTATEPEFFHTNGCYKTTKKMWKLYTDVSVPVQDPTLSVAVPEKIKTAKHPIRTCETACMIMANKNLPGSTAQALNIPKPTIYNYYKTYHNTGYSHKIVQNKSHVYLLSEEHTCLIHLYLKRVSTSSLVI